MNLGRSSRARPGRVAGALAAVLAGYGALQWLGRTWGSTKTERKAPLPGDALVSRPHFVTDHAVTVDAPPQAVWPWLVQMGWHRGGWYTARWVDVVFFHANEPSADEIVPELQHLAVGDRVPDGAPETECFFVVKALEANHHLVLHSQSHLPPDFRDRFAAWIDWTWVFELRPVEGDRCRFHFRSRARLGPRWLAAAYWLVIVPADFVMARQMLRGVRRRAERLHREAAGAPVSPGAPTRGVA